MDTKRYDRQIRLWGMETQMRMGTTRVLLCGAGGLTAEVAKNLVLSGVGEVVVQDAAKVTADDVGMGGQFLLGEESVGKNRAEASLAFLTELNPSVRISADTRSVLKADDAFLRCFDIVVATELDLDDLCALDERLRRLREADPQAPAKKRRTASGADENSANAARAMHLIGANAAGLRAYAFFDLGDYHFVETTKSRDEKGDVVTQKKEQHVVFPGMKECLPKLSTLKEPVELATPLVLHRAIAKGISLEEAKKGVAQLLGLEAVSLPADLAGSVTPALAPCAAIIGGIVGQEVIKIISGNDVPVNNLLVLDCVAPAPGGGARVVRLDA